LKVFIFSSHFILNSLIDNIERCTEIEKANRLLLEKMASIMSA